MIYQFLWNLTWLLPRRIWCFIMGHKVCLGERVAYEPDFCSICWVDWPQEKVTMPVLLNRCYVWAIDHGWPESVDLWLMKHVRLPKWWEY